jgi:hypothetical protein
MISSKVKEEIMKSYRIGLMVLLLLAAATFWLASKANKNNAAVKIEPRNRVTADSSAIIFEKIVVTAERPKKTADNPAKAKPHEIIFPEIVVTAPRSQPIPKEITVYGKRPAKNAKPVIFSSKPVVGGSERNRSWSSLNIGINQPDGIMVRGNFFKPDYENLANDFRGKLFGYPWNLNLD